MNLMSLLTTKRESLHKSTLINGNKLNLPTFHYFQSHQNIYENLDISKARSKFSNAQLTQTPSDIVYVMRRQHFNYLGIKMHKLNLPFNMRLSKRRIESFAYGDQRPIFWNVPGTSNSLLLEPISIATLKIKVQWTLVNITYYHIIRDLSGNFI